MLASVPLIPKFASEVTAMVCELRTRDTSEPKSLPQSDRPHRALSTQTRRLVEHGALGDALLVGRRERRDRQRHVEIGKVIGRGHTVRPLAGVTDTKAER